MLVPVPWIVIGTVIGPAGFPGICLYQARAIQDRSLPGAVFDGEPVRVGVDGPHVAGCDGW